MTTKPAAKIRVDMRHLTPDLLADAGELMGRSVMEAMAGPQQPRAIAAIAAIQNPDLTYAELCKTDLTDFDIVNEDADPKAQGASNGDAPHALPVTGT